MYFVDGLFGFGLNSAPRGMYKIIIESIMNHYNGTIGAIDIPTGLDCNTGKAYDGALKADFTVTLTAFKTRILRSSFIRIYR